MTKTLQEKILIYLDREIKETREKLEKLEAMHARATLVVEEEFNSIGRVVKYYMNEKRDPSDSNDD